MRLSYILVVLIILASIALSLYFYPQLPDQLVSHWNSNFQPDGTLDKAIGLAICPVILVMLGGLFMLFPRIDPLKSNVEKFRGDFEYFVVLILAFLLFLHLLVILWNLGYQLDFALLLPLWFCAIIYSAGTLCKRARRNWFVGMRTPWAMSSDTVWVKTNVRGGQMLQGAGLLMLLGLLSSTLFFIILLLSMVFVGIYTITYSYREYQKELKSGKAKPAKKPVKSAKKAKR